MTPLNLAIFSSVGAVAAVCLLIFIGVLVAHYKPDLCQSLKLPKTNSSEVQVLTPVSMISPKPPSRNVSTAGPKKYLTLEEHLQMFESPERTVVGEREEKTGMTLEFMPEDNTIIQVEGTINRITRILRTKIFIGQIMSQHPNFTIHIGELFQDKVLIYVVPLHQMVFDEVKDYIKQKDSTLPILTQHPRFIRYLGTCFNQETCQAYVISDYMAGCTLLDMQKSAELRKLLRIGEEEKIQGSVDLAEAVFFLHNLSQPLVHRHIAARNILIDGETLRFRLRAAEIQNRVEDMIWCVNHGGIKDFLDRSNMLHIELAPEILLLHRAPDLKSDIWALGATILEILLEKKLWDISTLKKTEETKNVDSNTFDILRRAMERRLSPSILGELEKSTQKLKFLSDCFQYLAVERPSSTFILRGMHHFQIEAKRLSEEDGVKTSLLMPGKRIPVSKAIPLDPLVRQQVEWNVRQEAGLKRRTLLIANRNYLGKAWPSLSANPLNDIRDVGNAFSRGGYGTDNSFENVGSSSDLKSILTAYVDAVNKDPEDIDIIVFYYSGYGLETVPENIEKKRKFGIFTDREGIIYDLALVMCNETMFPVATLQTLIAQLNSRVKRKLLILDTRHHQPQDSGVSSAPVTPGSVNSHFMSLEERNFIYPGPPSSGESTKSRTTKHDWEVPKIPEETTETLSTMFTIRVHLSDPHVIPKAVDSHPRRMNGYLTGCFLQVINENIPNISDLPKFLNNQMKADGRRSKAHRGIECKAEYTNMGNIWDAPLLAY